jgi:hypothetical protein
MRPETLGDLARAERLLEGLVERETSHERHRAADRYRRDVAAIGAPALGSHPDASCRRACDVSAGPFAGKIT